MYPFFIIFGRPVPLYGLMMLIGISAACLLCIFLNRRKRDFDKNDLHAFLAFGVCGALVGSYILRPIMKITEVALAWDNFKTVPAGELIGYIFGEIVFYGGLLGGLITLLIVTRVYKVNIIKLLDLCAPAVALGHGFGRIGCLLGGCCYGVEASRNHLLAIVYPAHSIGAPANVPLIAVPLIEALLLFFLAAVITVIYLKTNISGLSVGLYLVLYSAARFTLEFYRGDSIRGQYGLLTTSQYISLLLFVLGILSLIYAIIRKRRLQKANLHKSR